MNDEIKVTRSGRDYIVNFVDGDTIKCKAKIVKKVVEQIPEATPEDIAPILIRIKNKSMNFSTGRATKMKIELEEIGEVLGKLLDATGFDYERVREIIENLTFQEVEELFNSDDPIEVLENF